MTRPIDDATLAAMHGYAVSSDQIELAFQTAVAIGINPCAPRCAFCRQEQDHCDCHVTDHFGAPSAAAVARARARAACAAQWEMMIFTGEDARVRKPAEIAEWRRGVAELRVASGWLYSTTRCASTGGPVRLRLVGEVAADPRDGCVFPSEAAAEAYAVNRGALRWSDPAELRRMLILDEQQGDG